MILLNAFMYIIFFILIFFKNYEKLNLNVKTFYVHLWIYVFIFLYNLNIYNNYKNKINDKDYVSYRNGIHNVTKLITKVGSQKIKKVALFR